MLLIYYNVFLVHLTVLAPQNNSLIMYIPEQLTTKYLP